MWKRTSASVLAIALTACAGTSGPVDTADSAGPPNYPSDYTQGRYRVTELVLLEEGQGEDFNGDGIPDNNLPKALSAADVLLRDQDLSPEGFNAQIAANIESGELNLLLDVRYDQGVITLDLLSALPSEQPGDPLIVDPASYDLDGTPLTQLRGEFSSQTDLRVFADTAVLPIPFLPDEPPSAVPMRQMSLSGTADTSVEAKVTGLIPAQLLADDVLADLIPEEGVGNLSREQLLNTLNTFANLESIADIELNEQERAVSCALSLRAELAEWEP